MSINDDDLEMLSMELAKAKHIKLKHKIASGPTKAKLVETASLGFNEGFNSAEHEVKQQTGKSTDQIIESMQPPLFI